MSQQAIHKRITPKRKLRLTRRGVVSILAMMMLVLFGSLSVAMAIASQGNLRTAAAHLHVLRSMGAAETGMMLAEARLQHAVNRFVVEKGEVTSSFAGSLWTGNLTGNGQVDVLSLNSGYVPNGIADALISMHAQDENTISVGSISIPVVGSAPMGVPAGVYMGTNWIMTPAIGLDLQPGSPGSTLEASALGSAFQITYAPLADGVHVRVIVTGYDFDYVQSGRSMKRTIMQDYRLVKRIDQAVVSPSRIMIGKNVMVRGDLGATFTSLSFPNSEPAMLKSDFENLSLTLDSMIDDFQANLATYDTDDDNRLRIGHVIEGEGVGFDSDGDGNPDYFFPDVTEDGMIDEFDLFLSEYDANGDGKVALSNPLRLGTINAALSPEFVSGADPIDDDLALLIDRANPDRNRNGIWGFRDDNNNGKWDPAEPFNDIDPNTGLASDHILGYRDGVIDRKDMYAKVNGRLQFRANRAVWVAEHGVVAGALEGPIIPREDYHSPLAFDVPNIELPEIGPGSFTTSQTALQAATVGEQTFDEQVASHLGIAVGQLTTYIELKLPADPGPQFLRLDTDLDGDGLPDNHASAYFERMPFSSPNFTDWYYRPVYRNMVFRNIEIPMGTNGLFVNCTFVGVTWVRARTDNTHPNWMLYNRMGKDVVTGRPVPVVQRFAYSGLLNLPVDLGMPATALPPNQDLLLPTDSLSDAIDQADFLVDERPANFDDLPAPLIISGLRVTNTRPFSNNLRFHDSMFIGSITSDAPTNYTHPRNKIQFTGATKFVNEHPNPALAAMGQYKPNPEDLAEIAKSSMMLPQYSVDIGTFNSPPEQDIRLRGVVIAGVLDVRGNASIDGSLILTFRPEFGLPPLVDILGNPIGNPAQFNATLGYFGPEDGDEESLDPLLLPIVGGIKIVGYDVDGDGLADTGPFDPQPIGSTPVPFYGYGRIELRTDPNMIMPDGIMMPLQADWQRGTYSEGKL